jgi:hypothetical protein
MAFQIVQIVYWLALSTWFGGVLFIAIAAPVIFRTVRESNPVLPAVLSVNLEGQHSTLLAGSIVGNLLAQLLQVQLACFAVLMLTMLGQLFVADISESNLAVAILRLVLCAGAGGVVIYSWAVLWPRIQALRTEYIEHADEPEVANPAKDEFDREHRRSVMMMQVVLFGLLGIVLFSGNIAPPGAIRNAEPLVPPPLTAPRVPATVPASVPAATIPAKTLTATTAPAN